MAAILFINAYFSVQVEGRTTLASLTTLCQSHLSFNEQCLFPETLSALNASNCGYIELLRIMERNFPCKEEFALTLGLILTHFCQFHKGGLCHLLINLREKIILFTLILYMRGKRYLPFKRFYFFYSFFWSFTRRPCRSPC
jgi:hypothetical protein